MRKTNKILLAMLAACIPFAASMAQNVAKYGGVEYETLQAALDAAEAADPANIEIELLNDATLDIDAWSGTTNAHSIGTVNTQSITVIGNSHKLTFMTLNTDWNNVATMNDAQTKLILNDMSIAQGGKNTKGTWNAYDINFNCAVELNNVKSERPLAFKNSATLYDVTINNTANAYGIWISPRVEGQKIEIDGLNVTCGRGIKVDDQYVDNPVPVNLDIQNATFNTTQKSAILVKSAAKTTITAGNLDITNVAADSENAVWVDEGRATQYNNVILISDDATMSVEGGASAFEAAISVDGQVTGYYKTLAAAIAATTGGETVSINKAGTYTLPNLPENVTIEGAVDGVVFNHTSAGSVASVTNGATFKNVTFNFGNVDYHGFQHAGTINMEGCTLNGKFFSYGDMNFTDCQFVQSNSDYHMWCYDGDLTYTNCTFTNNATGKFLNLYNEGNGAHKVTVNGCKFVNTAAANKAALNVKATCNSNLLQYEVEVNNCTTEGAFPAASTSDALIVFNELIQVDDRPASGVDNITVTQDGKQIYPDPVAKIGDVIYPSLQAAVDAAKTMGGAQTITLLSDIGPETIITIPEVAGFQLTIDGKKDDSSNYTVEAQIVVDGLRGSGGSKDNGASVTLQNIAFANGQARDMIQPSHYPHHLTIQDCTYIGSETSLNNWFVNVIDGPLYGATIKNVTVEHTRLLQGNLGLENVFENIVATNDIKVGFNIKTEGTVLIKDCQITTAKYAFRDYSDAYDGTITLDGNTFISTSTESDEGALVNRGGAASANINVVGGTYTGQVVVLNNKNALNISGGTFTVQVPDEYLAEGIIMHDNGDGTYTAQEGSYVAKIGDKKYETLEAAFAAVQDGETITLLADCAGNGIKAPQGKFTTGLTVDFDGFTYTVDGSTVGSTGTETNGFQLLKDNKITFQNGTITSTKAKILIQNYSDLTLQGMTLTLNNSGYTSAYTLSNNNGNIVIDGSTINANPAGGFAFDVCRYSSYPSVSVEVKGESVIKGNIEIYASGSDAKEGFGLKLTQGTLNGEVVLDASAAAAMEATPEKVSITKADGFTAEAPADYKWVAGENGYSTLAPKVYVAQIGENKYESLQAALDAAEAEDITNMVIDLLADATLDIKAWDGANNSLSIGTSNTQSITINGNNHTLTFNQKDSDWDNVATMNDAQTKLVLNNMHITSSGYNDGPWNRHDINFNCAVELNNVTSDKALAFKNDATLKNVTVNDNSGDIYGIWISPRVEGQTIEIDGLNVTCGRGIKVDDEYDDSPANVNLDIQNATFNTTAKSAILVKSAAETTITAGENINIENVAADNANLVWVDEDKAEEYYKVSVEGASMAPEKLAQFVATLVRDDQTRGYYKTFAAAYNSADYKEGDTYTLLKNTAEAVEVAKVLTIVKNGFTAESLTAAEGYKKTETDEAITFAEFHPVCEIAGVKYETLEEAIAAAESGATIKLLSDCEGNGVSINKSLTIDFAGKAYTITGPSLAGSTGTKTQAFQLLKDNTITFKNGSIVADNAGVKMLIQNYSNLTLDGMTLDATQGTNSIGYVLSTNNGQTVIKDTKITAKSTGTAFDACSGWGGYASNAVEVTGESEINGNVEVSYYGEATPASLTLTAGTLNGKIVMEQGADKCTVTKADGFDADAPEGYKWFSNGDGTSTLGVDPATLDFVYVDGKDTYDITADTQVKSVTYQRTFGDERVGKFQAWFVPFDYTITAEDAEAFQFYKINMIANALDPSSENVEKDKMWVFLEKVGEGYVLKANRPYAFKPKAAQTDYKFTTENATLKAIDNTPRLSTETTESKYEFYGVYDKVKATQDAPFFYVSINGGMSSTQSLTAGAFRWIVRVTNKTDDGYVRRLGFVVDGDETGIEMTTDDAQQAAVYYDLTGRRVEAPVKGNIYVVKGADGKSKKVLFK